MLYHPAFDDSDADVIISATRLASSDDVVEDPELIGFRVYKKILALSSPFFKDLLSRTGEYRQVPSFSVKPVSLKVLGNTQVLHLPEDGQTVFQLLSAIYPSEPHADSKSLEELAMLIKAARKYQMARALSVFTGQYKALTTSSSAHESYVTARRHDLVAEAQMAAGIALSYPLLVDEPYITYLRGASGEDVRLLWLAQSSFVSSSRPKLVQAGRDPELLLLFAGRSACVSMNEGIPIWLSQLLSSLSKAPLAVDAGGLRALMITHADQSSPVCTFCKNFPLSKLQKVEDFLHKVIQESLTTAVAHLGPRDRNSIHSEDVSAHIAVNDRAGAFGAPFDEEDSDLILQSSQGTRFSVYKNVLRMASPFFRTMFTLPQPHSDLPSEDSTSKIPLIHMTEDTDTLHQLLSLVFPVPVHLPSSCRQAILLLSALQKYQLENRTTFLRELLAKGNLCAVTKGNAYEAFALAHEHKLADEASVAAQILMELPLTFDRIYSHGSTAISGAALYTIHQYRVSCHRAVLAYLAHLGNSSTIASALAKRFRCKHNNYRTNSLPEWWQAHFTDRYSALEKAIPTHYDVHLLVGYIDNKLPRTCQREPLGTNSGCFSQDIIDATAKDIMKAVRESIKAVPLPDW